MKREKSKNKQLFLFSKNKENIQWEKLSVNVQKRITFLLAQFILSFISDKQVNTKED